MNPPTIIDTIAPYREAGFALHWLKPRSKAPIGENWSEAPVATLEQLRASYAVGNNVGVRLGKYSHVAGLYLHTLDMDIRVADLADEAWDALEELFPDVDFTDFPMVQSGSGGESRHLHFLSDKAFRSKKLWVSEGKHRTADGKWHYDAELELFGTGKQVALPPTIHPTTGKPYVWIRDFDFLSIELGDAPVIDSADIESLAVAEHATYEFETREPLTFTPDQLNRVLRDVPDWRIDDRNDWIMLGQALHHQFGGSREGFDLWMKVSARGSKYLVKSSERDELRRYRGFGRNRRKPVTMASVVEWAKEARVAHLRDQFDEEDEDDQQSTVSLPTQSAQPGVDVDPIDALGDDSLAAGTDPAADPFDCLGDDDTAEVDDIDAIGTLAAAPRSNLDGDWISLLDLNEEGAIKPTLHNVELLMRNDPRLVGVPQLNEFTQETVQRTPPGSKSNRRKNPAKETRQLEGRVWEVRDTLNGELWSDDRDFAIRSILEAPKTQGGYGLKVSDRDLKAAVVLAANSNSFHPVREYLDAQVWDGKERLQQLLIDYVGATDDIYSRSVARLMMVAAVTRIYEPGHKYDFCAILEGLQGRRKSTFIQVLGKSWFGELNGEFSDTKMMIEQMQGKWIMEIPELSGFGRADVRAIKAFISTQADRARLAYARRAGEFPRQCVFWGSTNDREFLKDDTGGRRFFPILCSVNEIDIDRLRLNIDQIWAEAVFDYRQMRAVQPFGTLPLFLVDEEAARIAARLQESKRVESADDGLAGQIAEWLDSPVNTGSIDDDVGPDGKAVYRDKTCLMDIWFNCLGHVGKYMTADGNMLARVMTKVPGWTSDGSQHRFPKYGKQRLYYRTDVGKRGAQT